VVTLLLHSYWSLIQAHDLPVKRVVEAGRTGGVALAGVIVTSVLSLSSVPSGRVLNLCKNESNLIVGSAWR